MKELYAENEKYMVVCDDAGSIIIQDKETGQKKTFRLCLVKIFTISICSGMWRKTEQISGETGNINWIFSTQI